MYYTVVYDNQLALTLNKMIIENIDLPNTEDKLLHTLVTYYLQDTMSEKNLVVREINLVN
jgi:hypothetical protein